MSVKMIKKSTKLWKKRPVKWCLLVAMEFWPFWPLHISVKIDHCKELHLLYQYLNLRMTIVTCIHFLWCAQREKHGLKFHVRQGVKVTIFHRIKKRSNNRFSTHMSKVGGGAQTVSLVMLVQHYSMLVVA